MFSFLSYLLVALLAIGFSQFDVIFNRVRRGLTIRNRRYETSFNNGTITIRAVADNKTIWTSAVTGFANADLVRLDDRAEGQLMVFGATQDQSGTPYAILSQTDGQLIQLNTVGTILAWYNPVYKQIDAVVKLIERPTALLCLEAYALTVFSLNGTKVYQGNQSTEDYQFAKGAGNGRGSSYHYMQQGTTSAKGDAFVYAIRYVGAVTRYEISGTLFAIDRATMKQRCSAELTDTLICKDMESCKLPFEKLRTAVDVIYDAAQDKVLVVFKLNTTSVNVTTIDPANCQTSNRYELVSQFEQTSLFKEIETTVKPSVVVNPDYKPIDLGDNLQQKPNDANPMSLNLVAPIVALTGYLMAN